MASGAVPKRVYCHGKKKMVSLRVHKALWLKLGDIAERKGWSTTAVVETALDHFVQAEVMARANQERRAERMPP